jgi:hypothetical protein
MHPQLKNQQFQLLLNGRLITELAVDGEGRTNLSSFSPREVKLFLAVMTLICGEYPPTEQLILDIRTEPRSRPPELT